MTVVDVDEILEMNQLFLLELFDGLSATLCNKANKQITFQCD